MSEILQPFFPYNGGIFATVILPSRKRPALLCKAIDSIYSLAVNKNHIEFIVKADSDDQETLDLCEKLRNSINLKVLVTDREDGYLGMHRWINEIALKHAKGDWLFLFTDDAIFAGDEYPEVSAQNWDQKLFVTAFDNTATWHGCPDICSLICSTSTRSFSDFIFVRRKVIEILGHYSPITWTNIYLQAVLCFISSSFRYQLGVIHNRENDRAEDEDISRKIALLQVNNIEGIELRAKDTKKLISYIEDWRRKRCAICRKYLTEEYWLPSETKSYIRLDSGCHHGEFNVCINCADYNSSRKADCPICGLETAIPREELVITF
ncbi:glycosyltransferase family 2 protein [Candidatus Parcubacteria bacterium]|nr:MAG: glycosyltransferase family 2 protein [Candidatus Parcubacteria bacterium]